MEITQIKPLKKGLSHLYLDGEAAVKIQSRLVKERRLMPGDILDDEQLHELIQASELAIAKEKALYLLEYRSHSKKELTDKVARRSLSRQAAAEAVEKMEELGLVDDEQYARQYAKMLVERKKFGLRRVKSELQFKGIDKLIIEDIMADYEDRDSSQDIHELLLKKYPAYDSDEKVKRRAFAAMQRLGYGYDDIRRAMAIYD